MRVVEHVAGPPAFHRLPDDGLHEVEAHDLRVEAVGRVEVVGGDGNVVEAHGRPGYRAVMTPSPDAFDERSVDPDPFLQFASWYADAQVATDDKAAAMTIATATPDGRPSARVVLLRGFDERGLVFYTNYDSRKAEELEANPHAAALFYWPQLDRQIRVEGRGRPGSRARSPRRTSRAGRVATRSARGRRRRARRSRTGRSCSRCSTTPRRASPTRASTCRCRRSGVATGSRPRCSSSGSTAPTGSTTASATGGTERAGMATAGSSSGWLRDAGALVAQPALVLDQRHVDDDAGRARGTRRAARTPRRSCRRAPTNGSRCSGSRTCRRASAPRSTRRRRSRPGASRGTGSGASAAPTRSRGTAACRRRAADDADLGQRAVAADEREHEQREREEHETAEQPARSRSARPRNPPPGMRHVWFHAAVSDAARPVPVQSRPMIPMTLDATFVSCAVFTASVIVCGRAAAEPERVHDVVGDVARVAADEADDRDHEHEDGKEREEAAHADGRGEVRAALRAEPALHRDRDGEPRVPFARLVEPRQPAFSALHAGRP